MVVMSLSGDNFNVGVDLSVRRQPQCGCLFVCLEMTSLWQLTFLLADNPSVAVIFLF